MEDVGTWRCATASGSYASGLGDIDYESWPHLSATICGYRDGHRMNFVKSWNTSNNPLYHGAFFFEVTDCATGQLLHVDETQSFGQGTNLRSWTGSSWSCIDWTHLYKVHVLGHGQLYGGDGRHAWFSSARGTVPLFDKWSGCF